jgi:hypothetical protein
MSNMIILRPLPIAAVTTAPATGILNVLTPDPKEVLQTTGGPGTYTIDIDMGQTVSVDTFFAGYMGPSGVLQNVYSATSMGGGRVLVGGGASNSADHGIFKAAAPISSRYFSMNIQNLSVSPWVGIIAISLAFQPTYNREWGGGRPIIDTSVVEPLLGGGFGIGEGARKSGFRWTFGDLSDAEVQSLFELNIDRGNSRPIIVIEDPQDTAGLYRRIHYGLFDRFESYERQNHNQTRWALSMTEWV